MDPSVALPYWDWSADRTTRSALWAPDFLGGTGRSRDGRVIDGPFAAATGQLADSRTRRRAYVSAALPRHRVPELPTTAEVDSVLAMPTYDMAPVEQRLGRLP